MLLIEKVIEPPFYYALLAFISTIATLAIVAGSAFNRQPKSTLVPLSEFQPFYKYVHEHRGCNSFFDLTEVELKELWLQYLNLKNQ